MLDDLWGAVFGHVTAPNLAAAVIFGAALLGWNMFKMSEQIEALQRRVSYLEKRLLETEERMKEMPRR